MASAYDECCQQLKEFGCDDSTACRSCQVAFWDAFGMTPAAADQWGVNPGGSIADRAWSAVAEMAAEGSEEKFVGEEFEIEISKDAAPLEAYSWTPAECDTPKVRSIFREVRMMRPGEYIDAKGRPFKVTDADLKQYEANFNPGANPPILLDHEVTARGLQGWIRALRYVPGYDENTSSLMALWEFLGDEACEKVEQGLWKRVSGLFGRTDPKKVYEGSIVVFGAYDRGRGDRAEILKKRGAPMSDTQNPQTAPAAAAPAPVQPPAPAAAAPPAAVPPPAPPAPAAAPQNDEVAALKAQVADFNDKFAKMRKREDEQDFSLLLAEGYAAPASKEAEIAFMGMLPEDTKVAYLKLRRTQPKAFSPERKTTPDDPIKPGTGESSGGAVSQDQVLGALMAASGLPIPNAAAPTTAPETK